MKPEKKVIKTIHWLANIYQNKSDEKSPYQKFLSHQKKKKNFFFFLGGVCFFVESLSFLHSWTFLKESPTQSQLCPVCDLLIFPSFFFFSPKRSFEQLQRKNKQNTESYERACRRRRKLFGGNMQWAKPTF